MSRTNGFAQCAECSPMKPSLPSITRFTTASMRRIVLILHAAMTPKDEHIRGIERGIAQRP
jgi:hypothetical protein